MCPNCGFEKMAVELGAPAEMVPWRRKAKRRRQQIPPEEWREDLVLRKIYQEMQSIARPWRKRQALD